MGEANWICSLLCLPLLFTTLSGLCLGGSMDPLISGHVSDQSFKADSVDSNYAPHQARLEGNSWCSSSTLNDSWERPWLQVTFAMDVNISIIQTGGYNGYTDYYPTSFQVHVDDGTGGNLQPLTTSGNSMEPLLFTRTGTYHIHNTTLPSPITVRVLRIVSVHWIPKNQVCLRLEALGYPASTETHFGSTPERLISGSIYTVQDIFFETNSVHGEYSAKEARLKGNSWCSSDSLTESSEPWLQVTFRMDVNISIIQTGGYDGYWNYYLTSFQVHIGDGTEGSLHPLTISDNSTEPLEFVRNGEYDVEDTVLQPPVITQVLRIVAVGWIPSNQVCLRLEALGCIPSIVPTTATGPNTEASSYTTQETPPTEEISEPSSYATWETPPTEELSESSSYTTQDTTPTEEISEPTSYATQMTPPTEAISESSSYTTKVTPPTEEISEPSSYTTRETPPTEEVSGTSSYSTEKTMLISPQGQSIVAIVGGAVGGVLVLLMALLLLVVAIFIFARRSTNVQFSENCEDYSEHNFDNSIYGTETPSLSPYQDIPEHKFNNSIYEDRGEIKTENHLEMAVISSSEISHTYESIPEATTSIHEPIQDLNATLDFNDEEMQDNSLDDSLKGKNKI